MIFRDIRTDFNFIFGQFYVARKLILNGGAIRPTGLLLNDPYQFLDWGLDATNRPVAGGAPWNGFLPLPGSDDPAHSRVCSSR